MTDTEKSQVQQIREREQQATPGPWGVRFDHDVTGYPCYFIRGVSGDGKRDVQSLAANARFIEGARTDIPFLLDLLARQQAEIDSLKAENEVMRHADYSFVASAAEQAKMQAEIDRLRGERDKLKERAESAEYAFSRTSERYGLVCDELLAMGLRAESAESSLSALREALRAEIAWMDERRNAPGITTLGMIQERLRALLASPAPEDR